VKVFISWSGDLSHQIAIALHDWLLVVLPGIRTWVSSADIPKGSRWRTELAQQLDNANFGIVCVVPGNTEEPWLNFESGSLAKSVNDGRVAPLLVGLQPADLAGPLSQFQATRFDKEEMRRLVHDIATLMASPLPQGEVDRNFETCWPDLSSRVASAVQADSVVRHARGSSQAAAPGAAGAEPQDVQVKILQALATQLSGQADEGTLSRAFRMPQQKLLYHLEALESFGLLETYPDTMRGIYVYSVSSTGRQFLVSRGLL
jgi:hypothetical protein